MTVLSETYFIKYIGDGATVDFDYNFVVFLASDMLVQEDTVATANYTIDGLGEANGGTVTFNAAPAVGVEVLLQRNVPLTQPVDYRPYDPFPAETHEHALDRIVMQVQQVTRADNLYAPFHHTHPATDISYDNTITGLFANQVQAAIDALYGLNSMTDIFYYAITDDAGDGSPIDDLNNTDFTAQTGTTFAPIDELTAYIFLHKGTAYHWVGTRNVTVGVGGTHAAIVGQLSASVIAVAASVSYDNTISELTAVNVQDAIDELDNIVDGISGTISTGFKNVLINGSFRINQRGFDGIWTNLSDGEYGYDRWYWDTSNLRKSQKVEAKNMLHNFEYSLRWTSSITTTSYIYDENDTLLASGPSPLEFTYDNSYGVIRVQVPQATTYVQLERGIDFDPNAMPAEFEVRNIEQELAMCKRFYQKYNTGDPNIPLIVMYVEVDGKWSSNSMSLPVEMRAVPTVLSESRSAIGGTWDSINVKANQYVVTLSGQCQLTSSSPGYTLTAIELQAEL